MNVSKSKRIPYIDVAKGILILLVVYDHLPDVYMYLLKLTNNHIEYLDKIQWIYKLFFMPAFFSITGMCSNFNKNFKPFLISNFKTLILPNVLLGIVVGLHLNMGGVVLHGGSFWFLSSLFVAKLLYWVVNALFPLKNYFRLAILTVLVVIGFMLNGIPEKYDFWYFHYAFSLAIFLEMGRLIKSNEKFETWTVLIIVSAMYFITCFLLELFNIHKPVVAMGTDCTIGEIPLYLFTATTGTGFIILVSKWINKNRMLQYFGKESLVFYIFQVKVMLLLETGYLSQFEINSWTSVLTFVFSIFLVTIVVLSILSYIFESKYLSFLLGKF